jgi:hypothetical protein
MTNDSRPLVRADQADLNALFGRLLLPSVRAQLAAAGQSQRLRITSLPKEVADVVCAALQGDARWVARVVVDRSPAAEWEATATKLIEYRNLLTEPLLVFIPPGLRIAAEDSLDLATFSELSLTDLEQVARDDLFNALPPALHERVRDTLDYCLTERVIQNPDQVIRYLLTIHKNGADGYAAGGALFELGLIPHFGLHAQTSTRFWLSRNKNAVAALADARVPLQERITKLRLDNGSVQASLFTYCRTRTADAPTVWAAGIACDAAARPLALDYWKFAESADAQNLRLVIDSIDLPMQPADEVGGALSLPVLNLNDGKKGLKVVFRSIPAPAQVDAWATFRFQLLSPGDPPTSVWQSNSFPRPAGRLATIRRTLKADEFDAVEEGTYFLRAHAYDKSGAVLDQSRTVTVGEVTRGENESDLFLITRGEAEVEPPVQRTVRVNSLLDAWARAAARALGASETDLPGLSAVAGAWAEPAGASPRGDVHFRLSGDGLQGYEVVLPALIRKLEYVILNNPEHVGAYRINFGWGKTAADIEIERRPVPRLADSGLVTEFVRLRTAVFTAILSQPKTRGSGTEDANAVGIAETADLSPLASQIDEYMKAFVALAANVFDPAAAADQRTNGMAPLATCDTVELRWRKPGGGVGRAVLLAPTHPTRLAWAARQTVQASELIAAWAAGRDAHDWPRIVDQFLALRPTSVPPVLFDERGRGYVESGPLTAAWTLFAPEVSTPGTVTDLSEHRASVCSLLGVRRADSDDVDAATVAAPIWEYLRLHPYAEQLRINLFGTGDGRLIADVLRQIEELRQATHRFTPPPLRYNVQMFTSGADQTSAGDAVDGLLDPERQVGRDDEFTLAAANHLFPKLVFARNPLRSFIESPGDYPAHVSILADQFGLQCRVSDVSAYPRGVFVGGLVVEPTVVEVPDEAGAAWVKAMNPVAGTKPTDSTRLFLDGLVATQTAHAGVATGKPQPTGIAPVVALRVTTGTQALLRAVHDVSDWVITLDRNLGVEFYDRRESADTGYLLDFSPEYLQPDRRKLFVTTRRPAEVERIVRPALDAFGLPSADPMPGVVVDTLRSLSGKLALRLLAANTTQTAEVVGLLLARWLLEYVRVLTDHVVIPLDAHRAWFTVPKRGEEGGSAKRADLLLVGFRPAERVIRFNVVEVKFREDLSTVARLALYQEMAEQSENTAKRLRERFDPERNGEVRVDHALVAKELSTLLRFYTERGVRYGLIDPATAATYQALLTDLDAGYRLEVEKTGVLFHRHSSGIHKDEDEPDFPVHRIGHDMACRLMASLGYNRPDDPGDDSRADPPATPPPPLDPALFDPFASSVTGDPDRSRRAAPAAHTLLIPTASSARPEPRAANEGTPDLPLPPVPPQDASSTVPPVPPAVPPAPVETAPPPVAESPAPDGQLPPPPAVTATEADVLLGASTITSQFGLLGKVGPARVAIDLTGCNTISLFGVQGFGKSYTLGVIAEMAVKAVEGVNRLPAPLATVLFHYHKSDSYAPEFVSAVGPNVKPSEVERLATEYGARPGGLTDVVLLTPEARVEDRRREYPNVQVEPIRFRSGELDVEAWKFLLGAYGNDSLYVRQMVSIMRRHRGQLTLARLDSELSQADLSPATRRLAEDRLNLARPYIDDSASLASLLRPGRTVIVDLRDQWIEKDEALGLFVVMLRIFAASKHGGRSFNKLVVFDEAHKYISDSDLVGQVVETIREMRHQATSVIIASQDPLSVPRAVVELTSILLLHRMTSPQWLKHLKGAISALDGLTDAQVAGLAPGEALVWSQRSTEQRYTLRPQKMTIRPRFSQHGGGTKTAVEGESIR